MISQGEHALITGRTGSGKSVLAREIVYHYNQRYPKNGIVVINPKPAKTDWDALIPSNKSAMPRIPKGAHINWRVPYDAEDNIDDVCELIYTRKYPTLVVFDEGQELHPRRYTMPDILLRQGREIGISVVVLCQRPVDVTRYAITQATHICIYNVIGKNDLKILDEYLDIHLANYIAPADKNNAPKKLAKYHYLYYNVPDGTAEIKKADIVPSDSYLRKPFTVFGY